MRPLQWGEDVREIPGLIGRPEDLVSLDQWHGPGAEKYAKEQEDAARSRGTIDVKRRGAEVFLELLEDVGEENLPQKETARKICMEVAKRENCRSEEAALKQRIAQMRKEEDESTDDPLQACLDDLDLPASEDSAAGFEDRDQYGRMLPKRYKRVNPVLMCKENLLKEHAFNESNSPELEQLRTFAQVTKHWRVLHTMARQLIDMVESRCSVFLKYNDTRMAEWQRRHIPELIRSTGLDKRVPEDDEADEESREYRRSVSMAHGKKLEREEEARQEQEFMYNISQSIQGKDKSIEVEGFHIPERLKHQNMPSMDYFKTQERVEEPWREAARERYVDGESDIEPWVGDGPVQMPCYIQKRPDYGYVVDMTYVPDTLPPVLEMVRLPSPCSPAPRPLSSHLVL